VRGSTIPRSAFAAHPTHHVTSSAAPVWAWIGTAAAQSKSAIHTRPRVHASIAPKTSGKTPMVAVSSWSATPTSPNQLRSLGTTSSRAGTNAQTPTFVLFPVPVPMSVLPSRRSSSTLSMAIANASPSSTAARELSEDSHATGYQKELPSASKTGG